MMSYDIERMKNYLKERKKIINLFPSTYKKLLVFNGFTLKKIKKKRNNKESFKYIVKIPFLNKDTSDSCEEKNHRNYPKKIFKLPKIITKSPKNMKRNISTNIFSSKDNNNNQKNSFYLKTNTSELNERLAESKNNIREKLFNNNSNNNSNIRKKIDEFLKRNFSNYTYYDNKNSFYEDIYFKSKEKEQDNIPKDNIIKIEIGKENPKSNEKENISTKTVRGYTKEMKKNYYIKKREDKNPEEFHFFRVNNIRENSK